MIIAILLGCVTSYYNAIAEVRSVSAGGGPREFYVTADLVCGPSLFPKVRKGWRPVTSRIMLCQSVSAGKESTTQCDTVADTTSLGISSTVSNGKRFKAELGDVTCPYLKFVGTDIDLSGITPYDPSRADDIDASF